MAGMFQISGLVIVLTYARTVYIIQNDISFLMLVLKLCDNFVYLNNQDECS